MAKQMGLGVGLGDLNQIEFAALRMLHEEREKHREREHQMRQAISSAPRSEF